MNKKILIGSVLAAVIVVLASLTSVVGTNIVKSDNEKRCLGSPLFATRIGNAIQKDTEIHTNYLGKGDVVDVFFAKRSSLAILADTSLKVIEKNPRFFSMLLNRLDRYPKIAGMLKENDITEHDIERYIALVKNDPSLLRQVIDEASIVVPLGDGGLPLGLSTSNPLGCFIIALMVLPAIAIVISLLVVFFTLRVFQCLRIEEIAQGIFEQLIQGLTPP